MLTTRYTGKWHYAREFIDNFTWQIMSSWITLFTKELSQKEKKTNEIIIKL